MDLSPVDPKADRVYLFCSFLCKRLSPIKLPPVLKFSCYLAGRENYAVSVKIKALYVDLMMGSFLFNSKASILCWTLTFYQLFVSTSLWRACSSNPSLWCFFEACFSKDSLIWGFLVLSVRLIRLYFCLNGYPMYFFFNAFYVYAQESIFTSALCSGLKIGSLSVRCIFTRKRPASLISYWLTLIFGMGFKSLYCYFLIFVNFYSNFSWKDLLAIEVSIIYVHIFYIVRRAFKTSEYQSYLIWVKSISLICQIWPL